MQKNNGKVIVVHENAKKRGEIVRPQLMTCVHWNSFISWWRLGSARHIGPAHSGGGVPKFYATDDL